VAHSFSHFFSGIHVMAPVDVRKGMPYVQLSREEFERRYRSRFPDPAFKPLQRELDAIIAAAWDGYSNATPCLPRSGVMTTPARRRGSS
jgi:hypothetical protein